MTIFPRLMGVLGVLLIVGALVLLFANVIAINQLHAVASALRNNTTANPGLGVMFTVGLAAIGGLLAGAGSVLAMRGRRNN
ncbi:hypothetical protein E7T06_06025 [Deinococcus sp. Arct2-2]|uniref:hypothetical protein n=1 Tax=Deinococcus sp. Arct2-2 TaxID=2568653 RepID=UPI0010A3B0A9|nr:hypothetical protein [Deinococcus sp. Arct2-2]THF70694.1 hypothetical protein E7T06_06025 [Deinococcus sp. Arct2-2]